MQRPVVDLEHSPESDRIKILVPTSGPVPAQNNAAYIIQIARRLDADLMIVHIRDEGEAREGDLALDIYDREARKVGMNVELKPAIGPLVKTLVNMVKWEEPNLVIMGATRGRIVAGWIVDTLMKETETPVVILPWQEDDEMYREVISAPGG